MPQKLNKKGKPFSWSFTALKDFDCPLRYAHARFYCDTPFQESAASIWGNRVHKAGELFLKGLPHPDIEALIPVEKYATAMHRSGHKIEAELEVALTRELKRTSWFAKDCWLRAKIDVILTKVKDNAATLFDWKGLDVETLIPTPSGFVRMRDLSVGDKVFSGRGKICKVVAKSPTFHKTCYHIKFKDGVGVICDEDHLWVVGLCGNGNKGTKVLSASLMFELSRTTGLYIPVGGPVRYRNKKLLVHPYVLGCWLGDGNRTRGVISKPGSALFDEIARCGYIIGPDISAINRCEEHTIYGLSKQLTKLGVRGNKHIPEQYLLASPHQRIQLVQGLFDTDGYWNHIRGQAVLTTVDFVFAKQVTSLLSSLGQRVYCATVKKTGFGKTITAYDVSFTPRGINPFHVDPRTEDVNITPNNSKTARRYIKSIEEVPTVPTQCIAVDSEDNTYMCTDRYIVTHNTGKRISDSEEQLRLSIAALSVLRPNIEKYDGKYIWTAHQKVTGIKPIKKEDIPGIWAEFLPQVARMEAAWESENFPARPSGLCPYCPVDGCASRRR